MEFFLFLVFLTVFLFGAAFVMRANRRSKEFLIVVMIVGIMIATLALFTSNYEKWDARFIVLLLIITAVVGTVLATRR
jgi:peptidoglycan/LPS O-acetylase OafA/YrhL